MKKSLYIAVIGCGRLGSILASDLSQQGHEVVVIDRDRSAFDRLTVEFSGFSGVGELRYDFSLKRSRKRSVFFNVGNWDI